MKYNPINIAPIDSTKINVMKMEIANDISIAIVIYDIQNDLKYETSIWIFFISVEELFLL